MKIEREIYPMNSQACVKADKQQKLFNDPNYIAEIKWNGYRQMMESGEAFSRIRSNKSEWIPHITGTLKKLGDYVFDGELLLFPDGKAKHVTAIMQSLKDTALQKQKEHGYLTFVAFDLLALKDGTWIGDRPLEERRALLEEVWHDTPELQDNEFIRISRVYRDGKEQLFRDAVDEGLEGIMLKNLQSKWIPAKKGKDSRPANTWYKIKAELDKTEDVVIIGFKDPEMFYRDPITNAIDTNRYTRLYTQGLIGGVLIGQYKDGELVPVGSFSGITDGLRRDMTDNPDKYLMAVVEIKAFEREPSGRFISPVFMGLRHDKPAEQCIWE